MRKVNILFFYLSLPALLLSLPAVAADYLIKNGRLITASEAGVISQGDILIRDGKIEQVGTELRAPGATVIDASGAWVTPGLFDSSTYLGLGEVESSTVRSDHRVRETQMGAGFQVAFAIDRNSQLIPITRIEGVTRAIVKPSAGSEVIAGQSAIIHLAGTPDFLVNDSNAVFVELGERGRRYAGGSRAKAFIDLVDALREAGQYNRNRRDVERARFRDLRESTLDLEALVPVLAREKVLAISVDRASEIEMVVNRLGEFDIDLVVMGGREAWKVRDLLAARGVPVVIDPMDNTPRNFDMVASRLDNAAMLVQAGVTVAFMTSDLFGDNRTLTQGAGIAVAHGLDWQDAVAAITSNPAAIWGIADSYGRLEPGLDADVVIWNGDPLELMSAPTTMFIKGEPVKLESRQTQLRDRYRDLSVFGP